MSTLSVVGAIIAQLQTFTNIPSVYSFDVPPSVDAQQVYPSYIVVMDDGAATDFSFEYVAYERTNIEIMVYANTLAACSAIVEIVKYNGSASGLGQGLDFGQLPTLAANYSSLVIERKSEQYFPAQATGKSAQRIHACKLVYTVELVRLS